VMMKSRLIALLALLLISTAAMAQVTIDGDAKAGKSKASACMACHGAKGNSSNGQFPNLAGQHPSYLYLQLKHFKSHDRKNPIMWGQVANLSDQDMKDLAVYFSTLQMEVGAADKSVVDKGEHIYRGGIPAKGVPACAACHSAAGYGNPGVPYPRLAGQKAQYVATQLQNYRADKRGDYPAAQIMNGVAKNLSDDEIQAVASFVSGLYVKGNQSASAE